MSATTEAELIAWARANIANFKAPRSFEFRDTLPTSPQGKMPEDRSCARNVFAKAASALAPRVASAVP